MAELYDDRFRDRFLAMYDVRGIQDYIYRTNCVKDAMGASRLVESIIQDALEDACEKINVCRKREHKTGLKYELEWEEKNRPLPFEVKDSLDVQVLYIGGGNAFVLVKGRDDKDDSLCKEINCRMSKYIIVKTEALQLAAAYVNATGDYRKDYRKIHEEMNKEKADMNISKPLGALPIMQVEYDTGIPAIGRKPWEKENLQSGESALKREAKDVYVKEKSEKFIDNLTDEEDSRVAVVHIDGNNMGLRIRGLVEDLTCYEDAVGRMREISCNINHSFKNTFEDMVGEFRQRTLSSKQIKEPVRKIIVAGDDITYVCNAHIALETVAWFAKAISKCTLYDMEKADEHTESSLEEIEEKRNNNRKQYGFSVCAGIAYIRSHFPFSIGYSVAEECCKSAKKRAKSSGCKVYYKCISGRCEEIDEKTYRDGNMPQTYDNQNMGQEENPVTYFERIGNFLDFQICKNVQCRDLKQTRQREYRTMQREELLLRPYYIPISTASLGGQSKDDELDVKNREGSGNYEKLRENVIFFRKNMPRSLAKRIRNTYSMGENQMRLLEGFLQSRGWKMPDGTTEMYNRCGEKKADDDHQSMQDGFREKKIAKWYDALEVMDYTLFTDEEVEKDDTETDTD